MKKIITIALAFTIIAVASPVVALTTADLQAQIAQLQAQLLQLQREQNSLQGSSTGTPANCVGITFNRNLSRSMTGNDVKCMQTMLNQLNVNVANTGAGSPGNETTYFGGATRAAVIRFQTLYASEILTPSGLTAGTGFVGPATRAKLNLLLTGMTTGTIPTVPGTTVPVTGTGLTAMLATDNPVAGTVVANQGLAPLAKFTFVNGDSSAAKVTTLKLTRIGVSADASLSNVYLFDGANRLTDSASVSSGVITFNDSNGIFSVDARGSKSITVYSDLAASSGETLGVAINAASDITSTATAVVGIFPIRGNLMTAATATLAGVSFNTTTTPSTSNVNPANDQAVWQNSTTISTRAVNFQWFRLREIGSINYSDLQNFRLYVDGVLLATVPSLDSNGYVTFDLTASPKRLEAGTRDIKVLADIINGSSRTYSFSLRVAADARFVDTQYGSNVLVQANSTTFSARTTGTQTVNSGTLTIQKTTDSPSTNVVNAANNAVLAKYTLTAAGERIKVESFNVAVVVSDTAISYLRNGMLLANGVQVGSTANLNATTHTTTSTTFNLGSSLIVVPGSPVTLEVRADIFDADATNSVSSGDTITARILAGSSNAQGLSSLSTLSVPASLVNGNQLTVAEGSLALAKYTAYTNQSTVAPQNNYKLAHFTLTAATTENVNLSTIRVDLDDVSGFVSNLYVKYGTSETSKVTSVSSYTNSWSINSQLAAGQTIDVMVYADVNSSASGTGTASVLISGTTASSGTAVNTNSNSVLAGQDITWSSGSITSALDAGTPLAQVVAGNQQITAAKFKFTAANDTYTIQELKAKVGSAAISAAIVNAVLKDGSTVLATKPFDTASNTTAYFTGLNVIVPSGTSKVLTVDLVLSIPSADYSTTGKDVKVSLDWFKPYNSQGEEYTTNVGTDRDGNAIYVMRTVPTFTTLSLPSGQGVNLAAGSTTTIYRFKVAADSKGSVSLKQLKFSVTITDPAASGDSSLSTFKFFRGSTDITSSVSILKSTLGDSLESTTTTIAEDDGTVVVIFDTEENIPAGTYYEYSLKATPVQFASSTSGGDSVSTYLAGDTASSADSSLFYTYDPAGTGTIQQLASDNSGTGVGVISENVIWSDNSAVGHSYTTGASSADWFNGYLINDLPLDGAGVVAGI